MDVSSAQVKQNHPRKLIPHRNGRRVSLCGVANVSHAETEEGRKRHDAEPISARNERAPIGRGAPSSFGQRADQFLGACDASALRTRKTGGLARCWFFGAARSLPPSFGTCVAQAGAGWGALVGGVRNRERSAFACACPG